MQTHSPQPFPFSATVVLTSTVTAGKMPMVTVKTKHTERAITQIYDRRPESRRVITNRLLLLLCIDNFSYGLEGYVGSWLELRPVWICQTLTRWVCSLLQSGSRPASSLFDHLQAKSIKTRSVSLYRETRVTDTKPYRFLYLSLNDKKTIMKNTLRHCSVTLRLGFF